MKFLAVFFCFVACSSAVPSTRIAEVLFKNRGIQIDGVVFEDMINMYVDLLKTIDPIHITEETFFDIIGIYFKVKNVHAEGFSNVTTDISIDLDLPVTTFNFLMNMPRTFGSVEMWDTTLPLIYGSGSVDFDIKNVQLMMQIGVNFTSGLFEPVVFKPSIEQASFAITGVNNNEQYSQQISNEVNHALNVVVNDPNMHASIAASISAFLNGY